MNAGFFGWPGSARSRPPPANSLFLTKAMPGGFHPFQPHHLKASAGAAETCVWRLVDNGHTTSAHVSGGVLTVSAEPDTSPGVTGGAVHLLVPGDVDLLLAVSGQPPSQFSGEDADSWQFGAFIGEVDGAACGFRVFCPAASETGTTLTDETGTFALPLSSFLTDAVEMTPAVASPGIRTCGLGYFRLKRRGTDVRAYFSVDGVSWQEGPDGVNRNTVPSDAPVVVGVACAASMTTPAGEVSVSILEAKFLNPSTEFPS